MEFYPSLTRTQKTVVVGSGSTIHTDILREDPKLSRSLIVSHSKGNEIEGVLLIFALGSIGCCNIAVLPCVYYLICTVVYLDIG